MQAWVQLAAVSGFHARGLASAPIQCVHAQHVCVQRQSHTSNNHVHAYALGTCATRRGLLTMITVSMFTGATAAGLTAASLNGGITSLADLRGRPVVVWEDQEDVFKHTGVITIPMPA